MGVGHVSRIDYRGIKTAWGDWLDELGEVHGGWDWFVTLTFRDAPGVVMGQMGHVWDKIGMTYANRAWDKFTGEVADQLGLGVEYWFMGLEEQRGRGVPHVHALMGGTAHLRRDEAWRFWFDRYGFARILPYDAEKGARFYITKYVTKELGDWRMSENMRGVT